MLIGLNKNWGKAQMRDVGATEKDSKSSHAKPSERLCATVGRILDLFQCKLNFVLLNQAAAESDSFGKVITTNQFPGNQSAHLTPYGCITAVDAFARAMDG